MNFQLIFKNYVKKIRDNREKFSKLRLIFIDNKKPDDYYGEETLQYRNNKIVTSKVSDDYSCNTINN